MHEGSGWPSVTVTLGAQYVNPRSLGHQELLSLYQPDNDAPIHEGSGWSSVTVTLGAQYVNPRPLGHQELQSLCQPDYDAPMREGSGCIPWCPIC
jgi:hypothetical protein